jgi:hypothetical protein
VNAVASDARKLMREERFQRLQAALDLGEVTPNLLTNYLGLPHRVNSRAAALVAHGSKWESWDYMNGCPRKRDVE